MAYRLGRLFSFSSVLALVLATAEGASGGEASPDVTKPPAYERFVVIPLRVHILTATDLPDVDCHLRDADITRILGKVNAIWNRAGIHWGLESIVREPAAQQGRFRVARSLEEEPNLALFRLLMPHDSRLADGLNVYYVHKFPVNGVWLGESTAFIQETAALRPVEGGIDEPVPRVTAHELGHALGLPHRQARTNLLASGTTGTLLNAEEVESARREAQATRGAVTVENLRRAAEKAVEAGDLAVARRSWTWLSEIPGEGAAAAKKRLAEIDLRQDADRGDTGR
jgi:hypothetical protein